VGESRVSSSAAFANESCSGAASVAAAYFQHTGRSS
jgi:hypothetical protein